ncbi:hypothetical protein G4B88_028518 [Cannabis sativa]|uniref:Reverse transcriptase zinc-binding domain-containing protein n=1 Tax=Cannabis sativa TaxID=3483 RepID=A0A7J6GNE1_CANSA|nr:hypothetical protein G4B88_028518 [Cannabis sativa]
MGVRKTDLVTTRVMDGSATDITGFLAGADGVDGDTVSLDMPATHSASNCGLIGHAEEGCSAKKRMMILDDGRSVPLFGPWLKVRSRLENGFDVLKAEDFQERIQMEKEEVAAGVEHGEGSGGSSDAPTLVIHGGDNSYSILNGNGPPNVSSNPACVSTGDERLFGLFGNGPLSNVQSESKGALIMGHSRAKGDKRKLFSGSTQARNKTRFGPLKMTGPRGIPKNPVESKRKKTGTLDGGYPFLGDNSIAPSDIAVVNQVGVPDAFAEERKSDDSLKFQELARPRKIKKNAGKSESLLALEHDDGLYEVSVGVSNDNSFMENSDQVTGEVLGPWALIGDLNSLANSQEKFGGVVCFQGDFSDLSDFLMISGGIDLGSVGNFLPGLIRGNSLISSRNVSIAGVKVLPIKDFDHASVLLDLLLVREGFYRPFRFLEAWNRDPACKDVVKEAWNITNTDLVSRNDITDALRFRLMTSEDKFLGNPLFFTKSKIRDFSFVIEKDGKFSIKAAYRLITKNRHGGVDSLYKTLWKSPFGERVKLFLWKVGRDILPCGQRLQSLFGNASSCVLCDGDSDSLVHFFFHCPVAQFCWFRSSWGIRSDLLQFNSSRDIVEWILFPPFPDNVDLDRFSIFDALLCYHMWSTRNKCFHEGVRDPPEVIFKGILHSVSSFDPKDCKVPPTVACDPPAFFDLGSVNRVNLFVDAVVRENMGFYVVLAIDSSGKVLEAYAGKEVVVSPLDAEVRAILNAFSRCLYCGWPTAMIFSDCKVAVDAILARHVPSWQLNPTFVHLFHLCNLCSFCDVSWISRVNNGAAHKLAAWAASQNFCGFFDPSVVNSAM